MFDVYVTTCVCLVEYKRSLYSSDEVALDCIDNKFIYYELYQTKTEPTSYVLFIFHRSLRAWSKNKRPL